MRIPTGHGSFMLAILISLVEAQVYISPLHYAALEKRQGCPADFFSCEDQGSVFRGICCQTGQSCALDQKNEAACCPRGAVCTGTAPATSTPSFVSNSLFAFPVVPTSFSNGGACQSAYSQCSENFDICTSDLVSNTGGFGVTIAVPGGGGTTVAPSHTAVPAPEASSTCSSLSSQACHNLQPSVCLQTGYDDGFFVGSENAQPRQTAPPRMAGLMVGVGIGLLGAHV